MNTSTIVFSLLSMFAWMVISYHGYAKRKGWPVGELIASSTSYPKIASAIAIPGSAIAAVYTGPWWSAIAVVIIGLFSAGILIGILRRHAQLLSIVGLAVSWIAGIVILAQA